MTKTRWRLAKKQLRTNLMIWHKHEPMMRDWQRAGLYKDWVKLIMRKVESLKHKTIEQLNEQGRQTIKNEGKEDI